MASSEQPNINFWLGLMVIGLALVFFVRVFAAFRFVLFILIALAALGALFYFGGNSLKGWWERRKLADLPEGRIMERQERCKIQIEQLKKEQASIQNSIQELMAEEVTVDTKERHRIQTLIEEFKDEKAIRQSKIRFYQNCLTKLDQMMKNYKLSQKLSKKRNQLRRLQEKNYDDLGDLEEMKTAIDLDKGHLELIERLSTQMEATLSLDDTLELKKELDEVLELRDL